MLRETGGQDRKALVEQAHPHLSIKRQCQLLGVSRSSYYYQPTVSRDEEQTLLRLLDEQYLKTPFYGTRRMTVYLRNQGFMVNRKRVRRLMGQLGLRTVYPKRNLSQLAPNHQKYPYLLRNVNITHANQVWSTDITYLPVFKGHFYLVAMMDWYSRKVLSWRISNTLDVGFCLDALKEALTKYGPPEIFNSDQGSQFTSTVFTDCLKDAGVKISMDGRGRCHDNIFIERLWRSVKYELIYINEFKDGKELIKKVNQWFSWYNHERPHQSLGYQTPGQLYLESLEIDLTA